MIGMSQIRKRLIYGILIGAGVGVIGIIITVIWARNVVKSYENGTNEDYINNHTEIVWMLNRDVIQGEKITDDMLTSTRVHKSSVPSDQAGQGAVGQIAKYNIPANTPLINGMFGNQIVTIDERIQEISSVALPTGLIEGEYIDVKIKMPSGLEYVVLPQVRVEKIFGTSMWLYLDEEELYFLNSAIVDTYLNKGVKLYGVRYVDPTTQIKIGDTFVDEEGNVISISEQAKKDLVEKIEKDVADGTVTLTIPDEVAPEKVEETDETTLNTDKDETNTDADTDSDVETDADTEEAEPTKEYINFRDNLADLLLKYAIEYRYYVESYNKVARTYEPSDMVREHMMENEYITEKAKESLRKALEAGVRRSIEERLVQFELMAGEERFDNAVSGLENQITAQQSVRESTLAGE